MRNNANIELIGYVYRDPEYPMSEKHPNWIKFSMSVTKKWKNRSGEEQKDISWYKCSSWTEGLSNVIKSYVKAGAGVLVKGTPKATAYNDKDGNLKGQIEVNISEIITLTEPKEGWNDGNKNNSNQTPANSIEDDNIPF